MPRRKNAGGDADEGVSDAKKSKVLSKIDNIFVRWEWEGDGGKWTAFADPHSIEVSDAYNGGDDEVEIEVSKGVFLRVIIGRMVQKNKKTGWERRIRCCSRTESETDFYSWEWEDEHSKWNPYYTDAAICLETAKQGNKDTLSLVACGRAYTINYSAMEQVNDATAVVRKIRRESSDAVLTAASSVPAPSAKASGGKAAKASVGKKAAAGSTGAKAAKGSAGRSGRSKSAAKNEDEEELPALKKSTVKTVVLKGAAPVDPECTKVNSAHVYSEGKDVYDAMLNQTNVGNNNNKFYLMQVLQDDARKSYSVWFRWGRVGYKGQTSLVPCGPDLDEAKDVFCQKFKDKSKNDWSNRNKFTKYSGKYDMVAMDYSTKKEDEDDQLNKAKAVKKNVKVPDSRLSKPVQDLINLICDVKKMEDAVIEMKYDAKKAPLGKLTEKQINAGYSALKTIDQLINRGDFGAKLEEACSDFYTRIPHDFGFQRPPIIRTKAEVKTKLQLLEALGDIEIALKLLKASANSEDNPVDTHYDALKCELETIDKTDSEYEIVSEYLKNTHATTHNQYKMKILDAFRINKDGEDKNFKDCGNRMMLWHGSRITNWVGILGQGLRIAPPEAPVTGYMFGKGVYFADMSSKSANYCYPTRAKNVGIVLLCDVALGKPNELMAADYNANKLPKGTHSVMGKGKVAPDPSKHKTLPDGCIVPQGKGIDTGVTNPTGYTLAYNEFIVYDLKQIKMKYLLKVQFDFK